MHAAFGQAIELGAMHVLDRHVKIPQLALELRELAARIAQQLRAHERLGPSLEHRANGVQAVNLIVLTCHGDACPWLVLAARCSSATLRTRQARDPP